MAHYQQINFVEICSRYLANGCDFEKVLEVGSCDINGSIRGIVRAKQYIGIDVAPGPGVDQVMLGQDADFSSNYFDIVISCECFEHNEFWVETFANMMRMLKPGGVCIITCASIVRGEHGTPRCVSSFSLTSGVLGENYYRNLDVSDFQRTRLLKGFSRYGFGKNIYSRDLYFVGIKKGGYCSLDLEGIFGEARSIRSEHGLSKAQMTVVKISYFLRYLLAKMLGEAVYHNLAFIVKRSLGRV